MCVKMGLIPHYSWEVSSIKYHSAGKVSYRHIVCDNEIKDWIETQEKSYWIRQDYGYGDRTYWITDELLMLLILRWPKNENHNS